MSILIPSHLWPATAGDLYRIVAAIPRGLSVRVLSIKDGVVAWEVLA